MLYYFKFSILTSTNYTKHRVSVYQLVHIYLDNILTKYQIDIVKDQGVIYVTIGQNSPVIKDKRTFSP